LAAKEERRVISIATAIHGGAAILVISLLAWLLDLPLLFPALGPSAFILFSSPFSPAAAPRTVVASHFVAIATGFVIWNLVAFLCRQPVSLEIGGWPVLASASLALAITCALLIRLSYPHAPACATALIFALGAAKGWYDVLGMAGGVVLLAAQAVLFNRLAGVNIPSWGSGQDVHEQALHR
jgi:CBS-domain-containing membrane protein